MMTHDEMIAVIAAHRDGKKIQFRRRRVRGSTWSRVVDPIWNFDECDYRIESDPIEAWAVVKASGEVHDIYYLEDAAKQYVRDFPKSRIVHLVPEGGEL